MACGNNHVSRHAVGRIAIQGAINPVARAVGRTAVQAQIDPAIVKPQDDPQHTKGTDRYADDRGVPRLGNIYPHIHHGPDRRTDDYFVQASRAPRGTSFAYGPAPLGKPVIHDPHPRAERITFAGRTPPDPGLLGVAIDIIGALLRGETLR